ncbi:5 nucleotidase deoxy cytosolic type C [Actinobacillus indolicus]|nr:5 nucleotidase deoxy cytosolic type C [Actinobacillus indolicus]VTU07392.1 5 nucleotidase deoxy cytosolic type C [Actinobacillus indolicus]
MKKIVYIDMDNVIVDFPTGIAKLDEKTRQQYVGNYDEVEGIFGLMEPMPKAIEAVHQLAEKYDIYVLSTSPWHNPSAWIDKIKWIHRYFGEDKNSVLYKRVILSHHKNLNQGDYLIDDRTANGAGKFKGEHIHFGTEKFPDWESVLKYLL